MPVIATQRPPIANGSIAHTNGVLGTVVRAADLKRSWMKVLLYGRSRVGKSALSAQWPKPLLALACEPRENGGADTLIGMEGVDIAAVGLLPLPGEQLSGSMKVLGIYQELQAAVAATGKCPYQTLTIDVTALQDIILGEILGWQSVDNIIKRPKKGESGGAGFAAYMERATRLLGVLSKFKDLPCHTIFIGQEKDHNPAKDEDGNMIGSKLILSPQEKSFMSVSLGKGVVEWLQNACQYIFQMYMDSEIKEVTTYSEMNGEQVPTTIRTQTGKFVRRIRTSYHPNYAAGCTAPGIDSVPEYIEANTPKEMYDAIMEVASGRRTARGHYA